MRSSLPGSPKIRVVLLQIYVAALVPKLGFGKQKNLVAGFSKLGSTMFISRIRNEIAAVLGLIE